jgi:heme-degrading monooxygenase HmoA
MVNSTERGPDIKGDSMIRHIVAFKLSATDPDQQASDAAGIASHLEPLASVIPGVIALEVRRDLGIVPGHWEVVLVSDHDSVDALEAYQSHPSHVEAAAWVSTVVSGRAVVDFEVS